MKDIDPVSTSLDLCYSRDDGGWYFQDYAHDQRTSRVYPPKAEAVAAYRTDTIEWDE